VWRDEALEWDFDVQQANEKLQEAMDLAAAINSLADKQADDGNFDGAKAARVRAELVYSLLLAKLDSMAALVVQYAEVHAANAAEPSENMVFISKVKSLQTFMWANLTKDPTVTEVVFKTKAGDLRLPLLVWFWLQGAGHWIVGLSSFASSRCPHWHRVDVLLCIE
jgi:hypothetical protein